MIETAGGGAIVNVSSISALRPRGLTAYSTSKGAVIALTRAMVDAGDRLRWNSTVVVDKHSVGGLPGNRTTPIIVAIVAAVREACKNLNAATGVNKRPPNREAEYRVLDPDGNPIDLSQHGWPH